MDITVKSFDEKKAKSELKKCPKIVRDYVFLLKRNLNEWQSLTKKALSKLRERCNKCKGYEE